MENKKSKKKSANPLQEAFSMLKEATTEEYVDILKDEWNEMLERGKEPVIEFDNGDYYHVEPDWENKRFYAGHASNAGIMREIEMQMDPDMNLDEHIAELFDAIVELNPSLLVDDDWNDPDTGVEFVNIGESKRLKEDSDYRKSSGEVAELFDRMAEDLQFYVKHLDAALLACRDLPSCKVPGYLPPSYDVEPWIDGLKQEARKLRSR